MSTKAKESCFAVDSRVPWSPKEDFLAVWTYNFFSMSGMGTQHFSNILRKSSLPVKILSIFHLHLLTCFHQTCLNAVESPSHLSEVVEIIPWIQKSLWVLGGWQTHSYKSCWKLKICFLCCRVRAEVHERLGLVLWGGGQQTSSSSILSV